jgi:DnaJ family protein C protein 25
MRYNQEAYFQKYGASVLWSYAPKSDATMIIFFILVLANLFTWIAQKTRWQNVADRLIKAAVEDWSPSMGGSPESKQLREEALEMLAEQQKKVEEDAADASAAAPAATEGKSKAKKIKVSAKEKKQQEMENVKPIITELVSQVKDFGAGFHYPTWRDLMIVRLAKFPVTLTVGILWQTKYLIRRLQKKELNDEEHSVLTERAVGNVAWELSDEEGKQEMIKRELWKMENLVKWKEELELKNMSKADQKYHKMMMKKKGSKAE